MCVTQHAFVTCVKYSDNDTFTYVKQFSRKVSCQRGGPSTKALNNATAKVTNARC